MKEFKKPDLKAPRFRPEAYNVLNKEYFERFKEKYPKYKNLDNKKIKDIIKAFNKTLYNTVINTRDGIQLPDQIGWLFIGTCQQSKKQNVDFVKSKKYGVTVTNNNWDTDGKLAKIFFTNYALKHKIKNREFWSFIACRDFKRSVAKNYPENWNMYLQVEPNVKLYKAYVRSIQKDYAVKQQAKSLETYNEFDL
jgi:hypothetical protein